MKQLYQNLQRHTFALILFYLGIAFALLFVVLLSTRGQYIKSLDHIDITSLFMASLLVTKTALFFADSKKLRLVAIICLFNVAFLLGFEFIYKFLFFGWLFKSQELRLLLIFGAAAMGGLFLYFDNRVYAIKVGRYFLYFFFFSMLFWFFAGYPQLFEMPPVDPVEFAGIAWQRYPHIIPIDFDKTGVYIINRVAKGSLWMYFMLTLPVKQSVK